MKHRIKNMTIAIGLLAATALSAGTASAELHEVVVAYENRGWFIHDIATTFLAEGESSYMTVYLSAGDRMIARGEGAEDVRDLDVAVYLPNGRLLKKDIDLDATPYVPFTAPVSGTYTIKMTIHDLWSGYGVAEAGLVLAER